MIVIAIIGILAAALFPSLTAYMKRSRDAGRSANLNTISTAIGAFYSDREAYPGASANGCIDDASDSFSWNNYFPKWLPHDPQGATQSPCNNATAGKGNYGHGAPAAASATWFVLSSLMENTSGGNYSRDSGIMTGNTVVVSTVSSNVVKGTGAYYVLTN